MSDCVINDTRKLFEFAVPKVKLDNQHVQLGCHFEEFSEMLDEIEIPAYSTELYILKEYTEKLANALKKDKQISVVIKDRNAFLDAMADQLVTGTGVGYMFGMDIIGALSEVNRSNFSKFVDGKPLFNENGKLMKGEFYTPPVLDSFVGSNPIQ